MDARTKVWPCVDGSEFYLKSSVYMDQMAQTRLELLKSRHEVQQLKAQVSRLVAERAKERVDEPRRKVVRPLQHERKSRRIHSDDVMDQGDNIVSIHDIDPDSFTDSDW